MTARDLGNSPSGLFTASYSQTSDVLTFRSPKAKLWAHKTHDACLLCFSEIAHAFAEDATVPDLLWLADTIARFDDLRDE